MDTDAFPNSAHHSRHKRVPWQSEGNNLRRTKRKSSNKLEPLHLPLSIPTHLLQWESIKREKLWLEDIYPPPSATLPLLCCSITGLLVWRRENHPHGKTPTAFLFDLSDEKCLWSLLVFMLRWFDGGRCSGSIPRGFASQDIWIVIPLVSRKLSVWSK